MLAAVSGIWFLCYFAGFLLCLSVLCKYSVQKAYFGIELLFASKCKSVVFTSPSAILFANTLNSMRYIICPKHSFHVTQPSLLSIEPDFPFYMASHMYLEPRDGTLGADTSYIQHLSTRWREISNSHQFEHWYCQWQCLRQSNLPFTLSTFKEVEQDQNRVIPLSTK